MMAKYSLTIRQTQMLLSLIVIGIIFKTITSEMIFYMKMVL